MLLQLQLANALDAKEGSKFFTLRTATAQNGTKPVLRSLAESQLFWVGAHTGHQLLKHGSRKLFKRKFYGPECK